MMLNTQINPDREWVKEFKEILKENNGFCPCKLQHTKDTKCPCTEFREQSTGYCECGLYYKEENND